jgi:hypothetical protein
MNDKLFGKTCSGCNKFKEPIMFHKCNNAKNGLQSRCISCKSSYNPTYKKSPAAIIKNYKSQINEILPKKVRKLNHGMDNDEHYFKIMLLACAKDATNKTRTKMADVWRPLPTYIDRGSILPALPFDCLPSVPELPLYYAHGQDTSGQSATNLSVGIFDVTDYLA